MADEAPGPSHETTEAIGLATRLLTIAAENAKAVPVDIVLPITTAVEAAKNATLSPRVEAEFWAAFTQLGQILRPIPVESFSSNYLSSIKRQQRTYVICSIVLLAMLLPLSICGFIVTAFNADIANIAEATCSSEPALGCEKPALSGQPQSTGAKLRVLGDVNYASYEIYRDNVWLNFLVLPGFDNLIDAYKCNKIEGDSEQEKEIAIKHAGEKYWVCTAKERDYENDIDYADTFGGDIYFARSLKHSSDMTYGALGAYILPPLYAMLGACAFGFRNLLRTGAQPLSPTATAGPLVRLPLAALAGFVVGLFTDATKGLALPPLAIAFLVGYAAEIFFSFLDTMIETAKPPSRRA